MVTISSQPQLLPLTKHSLAGWIALSDHDEYFLFVDNIGDSLSVQLDEPLQISWQTKLRHTGLSYYNLIYSEPG